MRRAGHFFPVSSLDFRFRAPKKIKTNFSRAFIPEIYRVIAEKDVKDFICNLSISSQIWLFKTITDKIFEKSNVLTPEKYVLYKQV